MYPWIGKHHFRISLVSVWGRDRHLIKPQLTSALGWPFEYESVMYGGRWPLFLILNNISISSSKLPLSSKQGSETSTGQNHIQYHWQTSGSHNCLHMWFRRTNLLRSSASQMWHDPTCKAPSQEEPLSSQALMSQTEQEGRPLTCSCCQFRWPDLHGKVLLSPGSWHVLQIYMAINLSTCSEQAKTSHHTMSQKKQVQSRVAELRQHV